MKVDGTPKLVIRVWTKALVMVGVVIPAIGVASGQRVRQLTKLSKLWCPFEGGRGPARSTWTLSNTYLVLKSYQVVRQHDIGSWSVDNEDITWPNSTSLC